MFAPNWMRSNKGAIGDITDQGGQAKVTVTILSAAKGSAIYSVLYPSTQSSSSLAPKPSVPASPQSVQVQSVQVKLKSVKSVAQTPSPLKETSQAISERRQVTVEAFQMTVDEAEKNKPSPEQIFKTFDMDADGAITSEEFNDCCRAVGYII